MPTFLPFKSLMVRMGSCANSSKASRVDPGYDRDRLARIDRDQECRCEDHAEIDFAARDSLRMGNAATRLHVVDVGEAFHTQQLLSHILRGNADAGTLTNADRGGLRRPLVGERWLGTEGAYRTGR
jgi:hypothetical protein